MIDHEDAWINAINALARLSGRDKKVVSDPDPLVRLLRSDTPMTPGARDALAELLSPGDPPIFDFVLEPKRVGKFDNLLTAFDAVESYAKKIEDGQSSQVAAEEAGDEHLVTDRQIYRYLDKVRRLGERLRGADNKPMKPR
jgi:hypothetical protein